MSKLEVRYWSSSQTHDYVAEFIEEQNPKLKKKIFRDLEVIEEYGSSFANIKKLNGYDMHEITIRTVRIFCAIRGKICWLLHCFHKKTNGTPKNELNTAENKMNDLDAWLELQVA